MNGARRLPEGVRAIDIHCHVMTPACEEIVAPLFSSEKDPFVHYSGPASEAYNRKHFAEIIPKITGVDERLQDMDRMGIDVQAISVAPPQYFYWTEPDVGVALSRMVNDNIARIVAGTPDRFVGLGTLPLQDVPKALDELERVVDELGFPGLEICTNVNGVDFDDERFLPFFEKVVEHDLLLVAHPNGFTQGHRLAAYYLINTVGMPMDSTVFVARLIFGGVLERFPELKVCIVHGGGYVPSYPDRFDHAYRARSDTRERISRLPSSYLEQLYFDTMVFQPEALRYLIDRYGADRVLLGTDYPYDMGEDDPIGLILSVEGLAHEQVAQIVGGNAARLLKLPDVVPAR